MKRIAILILSAVLLAALVGCGNREEVSLLTTDAVIVTHAGSVTTVTDRTNGEQYTFTQRRVKRPQNAAEAQQRMIARTAVDTDSLTVELVHDIIILTVKSNEQIHHYFIQP